MIGYILKNGRVLVGLGTYDIELHRFCRSQIHDLQFFCFREVVLPQVFDELGYTSRILHYRRLVIGAQIFYSLRRCITFSKRLLRQSQLRRTSISMVLRFSLTSSVVGSCPALPITFPELSSSFLMRMAVFVRMMCSLSSSRSRVRTS